MLSPHTLQAAFTQASASTSLLERAVAALDDDDVDGAAGFIEAGLARDPDDLALLLAKADLLLEEPSGAEEALGLLEEARAFCLELDLDAADVADASGADLEAALSALFVDIALTLGEARVMCGDLVGARAAADEALAVSDAAAAWALRGRLAALAGDDNGAHEAFAAAALREPGYVPPALDDETAFRAAMERAFASFPEPLAGFCARARLEVMPTSGHRAQKVLKLAPDLGAHIESELPAADPLEEPELDDIGAVTLVLFQRAIELSAESDSDDALEEAICVAVVDAVGVFLDVL